MIIARAVRHLYGPNAYGRHRCRLPWNKTRTRDVFQDGTCNISARCLAGAVSTEIQRMACQHEEEVVRRTNADESRDCHRFQRGSMSNADTGEVAYVTNERTLDAENDERHLVWSGVALERTKTVMSNRILPQTAHTGSALAAGFTITEVNGHVPSSYCHGCNGGVPIVTYSKNTGGLMVLGATCTCGEYYVIDFWAVRG